MKRVVFLVLAVLIVSIGLYGDIGKGDWTQDEIDYFSNREYKGNCTMYNFARKWVPPYTLPDLTESKFDGYGSTYADCISKLIIIGKLNKDTEFRYLSLMRNEMYARNGYIFQDEDLKAFFNQMPWYNPISEDVQLNGYERYNVKKIKELEGKVKAIVAIKEPNPDTLSEKYIKKVIINAKWGKKEGEFALAGESPVYGPEPMIIDKEDNIYIADRGNGRIAKYNDKGELRRYYNYINYTDTAKGMAKWGAGGDKLAIKNGILYTNIYYYSKTGILSFNVNTGEKIEKTDYNLKKYYKELENLTFYGSNTEYVINETGKFKRIDIKRGISFLNSTVENIINKNYPNKLGPIKSIRYIGSDSLKNNYYRISIGNYVCIYKFSEQNNLLAYIRILANDYMNSNGYLFKITSSGNIYFLYPSGKVFIKDWKQKFIPGKIQLIKWELQK